MLIPIYYTWTIFLVWFGHLPPLKVVRKEREPFSIHCFCFSQLLIDVFIACHSRLSIQKHLIFPFISLAGSILWMAEYLNGPFLKILFPYNDKGRNSSPSALLFWIKLIKNPTRSTCLKVFSIKNCLLIPIRNKGRVVVISKAMESFYFEVDNL